MEGAQTVAVQPNGLFRSRFGDYNQFKTFVVNSIKVLLYAIESVINECRKVVFKAGIFLKERPYIAIGIASGLVAGGTYMLTAAAYTVGKTVSVTAMNGVVVGCLSHFLFSNMMTELTNVKEAHQEEIKELKGQLPRMEEEKEALKKELTAVKGQLSRMEAMRKEEMEEKEALKKELTAVKGQLSRMEAMLKEEMEEKEALKKKLTDVKGQLSRMEIMMQQMLDNQQQNDRAQ